MWQTQKRENIIHYWHLQGKKFAQSRQTSILERQAEISQAEKENEKQTTSGDTLTC